MKLGANGGPLRITTTEDGVVMVGGSGRVSREDVFSALELAWVLRRRRAPMSDYLALLVDLRAITLCGDASANKGNVPSILCGRDTAGALLARRDQMPVALDYCWKAAGKGAIVGAFSCELEAREWAVSRTLALRSQRARHQRRELGTLLRRLGDEDRDLRFDPVIAQGPAPMG